MGRWFSAWLLVLLVNCQHIEPVRIRTQLSQIDSDQNHLKETNTLYLLSSHLVEQSKWRTETERFEKLSLENKNPKRCMYLNNEAVYRSLILSTNLRADNQNQWQNIISLLGTALKLCRDHSLIEENFRTAFVISRIEPNQ